MRDDDDPRCDCGNELGCRIPAQKWKGRDICDECAARLEDSRG